MCFDNNRKQKTVKIAEQDIKSFKALISENGKLTSPIKRKTKWRLGKIKKVWFMVKKGTPNEINRGLHSAKTVDCAQGYYSGCIYNCIIPKGAAYWENDDEYVSNALRVIDKVTN